MRLKCIGGPADGRVFDFANHLELRVLILGNDGLRCVIYTRRVLRSIDAEFGIEELSYLAPAGVSDADALRHLLEPPPQSPAGT
jgi:hypothetical protein